MKPPPSSRSFQSTHTTVLHVVVAGELGGAERMLVELARDKENRTTKHMVALFTQNTDLIRLLDLENVHYVHFPHKTENTLSYLSRSLGRKCLLWLTAQAKSHHARIIHVHTFGSQVLGTRLAKLLSLPLVRTEHSIRAFVDPSCLPFALWSSMQCQASVSVSSYVQSLSLTKFPWLTSVSHVIPNGISPDLFFETSMPPLDEPRFLALGRLDPRKGIDRMIQALRPFRNENVHLDVVGDGPEFVNLIRLVKQLGMQERVHFYGLSLQVQPHIENSHFLISAAHTEGLGLALLEGMSMAKPVLALPVGGIPEFVTEDTGYLAKSTSVSALQDAIALALKEKHLWQEKGRRARELILSRYSAEQMRLRYDEIYTNLSTAL